ncbi:hypothetical protein [Bradyrhizobium sp. LHD-71]|uniref:hypothetical protein n=1 Tax=Bradyrhizobium sp. LHD-71 TaxID=3072141 RepID=UPI00280F6F1C|nr:hypothetical protein [Bradyrhizobium sp. LHD-71]MDQ8729173.1 hypothetical protein [Bradyrhizobium sp. LHD-71]
MTFEPFGERLGQPERRQGGRMSSWLLRTGAVVFWSAVVLIVAARATYFDPGVFDFDRLAAILRSVLS